jgi:hypothetical protein
LCTIYGVRCLIVAAALAVTCGLVLAACNGGDINGFFGYSEIIWAECCPGVTGDVDHYDEHGEWDPCFGNKYKPPYGPSDGCIDGGSPDATPPDAASSDAASSSAKDSCPDPQRMCRSRPFGWDGPWLLWSGPPDQVPECPDVGPMGVGAEVYDDLAPTECESCECAASTGTCSLSSGLTAHDVSCEDLGKPHHDISFDAKVSWNGECDNANPVDAMFGIASLSISAVEMHTNGCAVVSTVPRAKGALPARWNTLARTCAGSGWTSCNFSNGTCIQKVPEPFKLCIGRVGVFDCPSSVGHWYDRRIFYGGVNDQRTCTDCTCGPPKGDVCVGSLSVYDDGSCTHDSMGKIQISSVKESCFDILPAGNHLGSKSAVMPAYFAGACAPLPGQPNGGTAEKIAPVTFCCEP